MKEHDAWLWLAALIDAVPDAMITFKGKRLSGLCSAVEKMWIDDVVSQRTFERMDQRIARALEALGLRPVPLEGIYLHQPYEWHDGVRRDWCLTFADQATPRSRHGR